MAWMDVTHFTDAELIELASEGLLYDHVSPNEDGCAPCWRDGDLSYCRMQERRMDETEFGFKWYYFVQVDE